MDKHLPQPPRAARVPHRTTHHGITRDDPYFWLRADNWQEVMRDPSVLDPDIRAYLEAENDWFDSAFGKNAEGLTETLYKEIRGRIKEDDSSIPTPDGPFAYFSRTLEGKQYPQLVRTARAGGEEKVLIDCNVEAEGVDYFGFGGAGHSPDHSLLLWAADRKGSEFFTLSVRDLQTGRELEDRIERASGGGVWGADGQAFYYTELDDNHRPYRVLRHRLGTLQAEDEVVYEEKDPGFFVSIGKMLSRKYITIAAHDHQTSEIHLIDAGNPGVPRLVASRETGREYDADERDGLLYILTNADGAEDFKIVTAPAADPGPQNWTDLIAHREGVLITAMIVISGHMIRLEKQDGLPRIVVRDLKTGVESEIAFMEEAYSLGFSVGYEFDTTNIRFSYSSPTTPNRTYDYDLATGARVLLKEQIVPSGHDPDDYETRRLFATAPDGEKVPVTLLFRKGLETTGDAPVLLYGYGAYGHSMTAHFSISALSLVDRGMIHAIAHVRGGKDKGYRWYRLGKHRHKTNSFTDFIAAAELLVAAGYTRPGRIVAEGGSAGGMLMGAIANMRPDLFAGIIAQVPFVDVLNTMLDDTLPLTPPEWPEWGNPIASEDDFRLIASYSPYDNVEAKPYPPIFALAGLTDPRVTYWEPAKWVARLRASKTDDNPLFLKTNMGAGHGGASGRFDRLKEVALTEAFALWVTGVETL
ncbi:MAG: S9 family peptidase [Alphaproteobacteria bacterium]|nr:S9 family peptidase [Alphaproteobacteria bacterium]